MRGYHSSTNLEKCAGREQAVAMPEAARKWPRSHPYHKERFTYNAASDSFTCPQGQRLKYIGTKQPRGVPYRHYRAPRATCQSCPAFGMCTKSLRKGRAVTMGPQDALLIRHRDWMATDGVKEVYRLRRQLVEPVFGIIKEQQEARRFLLRGLLNVAAEWSLLATPFNLRTLCRAWRRCPSSLFPVGPHPLPTP